MTRMLGIRTYLLIAFVFLAGCSGGGSEGTGTGSELPVADDETSPTTSLEGLDFCTPQFSGQSLLCGNLTSNDSRIPIAGIEVTLVNDRNAIASTTELSNRGIADEAQCLSNFKGQFACVLPAGISGMQTFNLVLPIETGTDVEPKKFEVIINAGETTTVPTQNLSVKESVGVLEASTSVRYLKESCGVLPIQSLELSIDQNSPTSLLVGTINQVELGSRNKPSGVNYWEFDVAAGTYHLVIDAASSGLTNVLNMNASIWIPELSKFRRVIDDIRVFPTRMRSHVTIIVERDMSLVLKVVNDETSSVQYQIGLFETEMAVPTPFLSDCIDVVSLSLGSTEFSSLERWGERWFSLEVTPGEYEVSVRTFNTTSHIYHLDIFTDFAQSSTESKLYSVNEMGYEYLRVAEFTIEESNIVYFRLVNHFASFFTEFELTINKK